MLAFYLKYSVALVCLKFFTAICDIKCVAKRACLLKIEQWNIQYWVFPLLLFIIIIIIIIIITFISQ